MFRLTDKWNTGLVIPERIIQKSGAGIFRLAKRARIRLVALEGECRRHGFYRQWSIVNEQIRLLILTRLFLVHVTPHFAFGADSGPGKLPAGGTRSSTAGT